MRKMIMLAALIVAMALALALPATAQEEGTWEYLNDVVGWAYVLPGEYHQTADGSWMYCWQDYGYNPEAKKDVWNFSCKPA